MELTVSVILLMPFRGKIVIHTGNFNLLLLLFTPMVLMILSTLALSTYTSGTSVMTNLLKPAISKLHKIRHTFFTNANYKHQVYSYFVLKLFLVAIIYTIN